MGIAALPRGFTINCSAGLLRKERGNLVDKTRVQFNAPSLLFAELLVNISLTYWESDTSALQWVNRQCLSEHFLSVGPSLKSNGIRSSQSMVQLPSGGVAAVQLGSNGVYHLSSAASTWTEFSQGLASNRDWTTALLIPDSAVYCIRSDASFVMAYKEKNKWDQHHFNITSEQLALLAGWLRQIVEICGSNPFMHHTQFLVGHRSANCSHVIQWKEKNLIENQWVLYV